MIRRNDRTIQPLLVFVGALVAALAAPTWAAALPAPASSALTPAVASVARFRSLDDKRTLPAEIITEVMFDRTGFLWIGTREGLFLYDGQHFRHFQHDVQNPDSISSNGIRGVFEDSRGRLWIATISGGLDLLNRATWRFRSWRHDRNDPHSISHDGVFVVSEAPGGKLWVGTQAGLDLFDPASGRFEHQIIATGGEFVITVLTDDDGCLWVGTLAQGLFRRPAGAAHFVPVRGPAGKTPTDIFSLAQDAAGRIWVGTREGLYRVNADQDRIVDAGLVPAATVAGLGNVTALQPTADGGLWIGTFGAGLYRLAPQSRRLIGVTLGPMTPGARTIDGGALALDRDGALFAGTFGAGLFRTRVPIAGLHTWQARSNGETGLSNQDVYAVLPTPSGLLVGSFGGGIDRIAADSGRAKKLPLPAPAPLASRVNGITDLLRTRDGVIWAATNEGVYRWDRQGHRFHYYEPDQPAGPSANPGYSYALFQDRDGRIWIGTGGGGLYLYQRAGDSFRNFRPVAGDPHSLADDFVTAMIEDRRGRLWIGTRSGGLGVCRVTSTLACVHLPTGSGPREVSHDHITSLLLAADGGIWAGTAGGGLNHIALADDGSVSAVRHWTRNDGLADDNVMALVYAPDGALWLSTHGGLSRLDPATGELSNITASRGLPTAVFNPKAALLYHGRLVFGSAKGVVALDPTQPQPLAAPPTVIEAVLGLGDAWQPNVPAWQLRALEVPWRQPFSLELAVLGYDAGQPQFQYRLDPSQPWFDLGNLRRLTLHALAPGHHQLQVRGRRGGHAWTLAPPLELNIVPPLWRRTWVQAGAATVLLLLVFGGLIARLRELQARNATLQRAHRQREQALAEANTSREQQAHALALLRRMTMRMQSAKEDERRHLARELHDEFGQALTSAKINLGLALSRSSSAAAQARVSDTIGLIESMIGQVRALSLELRPALLDELGLLPALEGYLHAVSERSGIPIAFHADVSPRLDGIERETAIFRVIQEAVTNALRHAQASRLRVRLSTQSHGVRIYVHDDGCGFDAASTMATGSGLGLFGMRERVYDLGGEWTLESQPGQGTTLNAFIPDGESLSGALASAAHARHPG